MRIPKRIAELRETIGIIPESSCLAKTCNDKKGCSVRTHSLAAFHVAEYLINRVYAGTVLGKCLKREWLLGPLLHDIGKLSPAFQTKIHTAAHETVNLLSSDNSGSEKHADTSCAVLRALQRPVLAEVAAVHHGTRNFVCDDLLERASLGRESWQELRIRLIQDLCREAGLPFRDLELADREYPLACGLLTVADWIASGMDLQFGEIPARDSYENAVRNAGFIPFHLKKELSFEDLFGFPPHVSQRKIMEQSAKPGAVFLLEMEMGAGKTEAALALAYRLMLENNHNGIYFAMPTQLTSGNLYLFERNLKKGWQ